jgi:hypothetical protein
VVREIADFCALRFDWMPTSSNSLRRTWSLLVGFFLIILRRLGSEIGMTVFLRNNGCLGLHLHLVALCIELNPLRVSYCMLTSIEIFDDNNLQVHGALKAGAIIVPKFQVTYVSSNTM